MLEKKSLAETPLPSSTHHQHPYNDPIDLKSTLSIKEKWLVVSLSALAAFFSPVTANIYFPAIPTIARAFHKPAELINLTVTVYVILQGTAPMFWGTMSDSLGRRPIFALCLLILSLSCVGLALVPTSAYWLLMVLRCIQAAGSTSTLAIGAGVISDISTPAERGGFYGIFALGPMAGPALGPVIGGALTQSLGWRSIFWFLCIAVSIYFVVLVAVFPETLPSRQHETRPCYRILYTPVIPIVGRKPTPLSRAPISSPGTPGHKNARNPFLLYKQYNIVFLLILNSTTFSIFFSVVASLSTLFEQVYPSLDELRIGLCYLAIGGGMVLGTGIVGKILDWRYQVEKKEFCTKLVQEGELEQQLKIEGVKDVDKLRDFPLERARLKYLSELIMSLAGCCVGYGWCLEKRVHLAAPLMFQLAMGLICVTIINATTTLMIDLAPGQGSAVTACNNLLRSSFSAIIISIIQPLLNAIGMGWTYTLHGAFVLASLPFFYFVLKYGPRWRGERGGPIPPTQRYPSPEDSESMGPC